VESRLLQLPGNHLVMVRRSTGEAIGTDWVYNSASIDKARIVWAHELSPQENNELLRYFEGRSVWTAEVRKAGVTLTATPDSDTPFYVPGEPRNRDF
jgi:hypothetical protein